MSDFYHKIETLKRFKLRKVQKKYIEYIRYPFFKNLEENTRIDFDFPITFLVGKNGGGKTSTLQSLYGCPQGYSLGEFWFTTELDPILEFKNNRNCVIYGYEVNNETREVLKQRIYRSGNPDYWETSKPIKGYGMLNATRFTPIEKNVEYFDFRSELSAFDKFMHFLKFHSRTHKTKQDYLRHYSKKLKDAFDKDIIIDYYVSNRNKKKINLTKKEVQIVSQILGKNYTSIEIIEHNLFKDWGVSIRLKSQELSYSEAFAGSGETAIVMLVYKIYNAEVESLILLDEPETSLHGGAQKRLMNFIIDMCIEKKHQFIISTHSPFLIEEMPDNSIKVFSIIDATKKFFINPERNYREAFYELEIANTNKKNILVEDHLAKLLLDKVLDKMGQATKSLFEVKYLPGGANDINQRITTLMEVSENTFIIFDGDQKKQKNLINLNNILPNEQDCLFKLKKLIKEQVGSEIKFHLDGGNKSNEEQEINLSKKYLNFYREKVHFFPETLPEDIIWDLDFASKRLNLLYPTEKISNLLVGSQDSKENFSRLCCKIFGDNKQVQSLYLEFINYWLNKNDDNFIRIGEIIKLLK